MFPSPSNRRVAQPRQEAWSPDSQPRSSYTNGLDLPNNRTQESILPWPRDNVTTLTCQHRPKQPPGKLELLKYQHEDAPDSKQSRHALSGTSAGTVEDDLPGVITRTARGGRQSRAMHSTPPQVPLLGPSKCSSRHSHST